MHTTAPSRTLFRTHTPTTRRPKGHVHRHTGRRQPNDHVRRHKETAKGESANTQRGMVSYNDGAVAFPQVRKRLQCEVAAPPMCVTAYFRNSTVSAHTTAPAAFAVCVCGAACFPHTMGKKKLNGAKPLFGRESIGSYVTLSVLIRRMFSNRLPPHTEGDGRRGRRAPINGS